MQETKDLLDGVLLEGRVGLGQEDRSANVGEGQSLHQCS